MNDEKRHFAVIDDYKRKLTILYGETVVAETTDAKILKESGKSLYNPVFYIPKEDVKIELVRDENTTGFCPIKGHAHRWHLKENSPGPYFGWSYEEPFPKSKKIAGHIAFNMQYVTLVSAPL